MKVPGEMFDGVKVTIDGGLSVVATLEFFQHDLAEMGHRAITLRLPPLRDRPHDIRLLANHFVRAAATRYGRPVPRLTEECLAALTAYSFPGNVRELESEMSRLAALASADAPCGPDLLNERIRNRGNGKSAVPSQAPTIAPMSLHEMEKQLISSVLEHTNGNRTRAADILGISREGLRTKLQRLQIPADQDPLL